MKKKLFILSSFFFIVIFCNSQSVQLLTEDFQGVNNLFNLNTSGPGSNTGNNQWVVNSNYVGIPTYPNTMPQDSTYSGTIGMAPYSKYMHINDVPSGVTNANYNPTSSSDRFAAMNSGICTVGMDSIHISFFYLCEGSATAYGKVYYSKNNGPWIQVGLSQYNNKYKWKYEDITDPAFSNCQSLRFGFRWENNSGAPVNSESFSIDDVDIVASFSTVSPITITVDSVSPIPVCQGGFLAVYWHLSDTLCDGSYIIELSNALGVFNGLNNWVTQMFYPQTLGNAYLQLPTSLPAGACYRIRIRRTAPPPVIVSNITACFSIIVCPNVITTLQPVVTLDTNAVCVGSDIDVPFYSTGVYTFNTYTAQLSDSNGIFSATPPVVGTAFNSTTYNPALGSNPGNVSGQIPIVPAGCGYYIRVVSSNPVSIGAPWGPFCIGNCDITTNNKIDLHFCVEDCAVSSAAIDTVLDVNINSFDSLAIYNPGNLFTTQMFSMTSFSQIGANGILGSVAATGDTTLKLHIPCKDSLAVLGIPIGTNYVRIIATNSTVTDNTLGTIIRLTIGAPHSTAELISAYDYGAPYDFTLPYPWKPLRDTFCTGDVVMLMFEPYNYNDNSTYKWICNGINGGNPFVSPSGANSNTLYVTLGAAGILTFKVQETNYGCTGPWSPVDTIWVFGPPVLPITGPSTVCQGDTNNYYSLFQNNTYYNWTTNGGIIVDTANNVIDMAYPNLGTFQMTIHAINSCGSASQTKTVTVKPYPTVNAGLDTTICINNSVLLFTQSGTGYSYLWSKSGGAPFSSSQSTTVTPTVTTTYVIQVTSPGGCKRKDTVNVFVEVPSVANYLDSVCPQGVATVTIGADTTGIYSWNTGDTSKTITVNDTGTYVVTVTIPGSICGRQIIYHVSPLECPLPPVVVELVLPNIFSPNGDSLNDYFTPVITGDFDYFAIKIFNRWGQLIFESTDSSFKWFGTNKEGKALPDGTYYYIAETTIGGVKNKPMRDFVTLVR